MESTAKAMERVAMIIALVCWMVCMTAALRCGVSAPQVSLSEIHEGCNDDLRSRHADCVSAMHRFCNRVIYPTAMKTVGVSREHINGIIGMSCIRSALSQDVSINELQQIHSGCNTYSKSQHRDCLSAIHRYCQSKLGAQYAGTSQEVPSKDLLYVGCFDSPRKEWVRHDVLKELHNGCIFPNSDSDHCYAAASRWCQKVGYSGGITQEVNEGGVLVACYNAEFSNDEFVVKSSGFYEQEFRVAKICTLDFELDSGKVLSQTPQFIGMETYDNRKSGTPLHNTFQVSKQVTEINSFTHSHSLTISAGVEVSAKLPFFGGSKISLSTSISTGVSFGKENSKTVTYSTDSDVVVPAGKGIIKKAIVQKATLDVPWKAKAVNGLGKETVIKGNWRGVNTFNFRVTQTDLQPKSLLQSVYARKSKY